MTITIDLPPEEEAPLRKRAARQGKGLDDFVQQIVRHEAKLETQRERLESDVPQGQSLAEALKGLIGVLDSSQNNKARSRIRRRIPAKPLQIFWWKRKRRAIFDFDGMGAFDSILNGGFP